MWLATRPFALVMIVAGIALGPLAAAAQSDTGEIDLTVVDTPAGKPIGNVRTFLLGAQTANALTTASGAIKFTDVPVGIYRVRVQARGYNGASTREFDVLPDRAVRVRIELSQRPNAPTPTASASGASAPASSGPSGLKTIAVVTSHPRVSITTTDIDADSPIRRLSDSLTDALDKLAGVNVTTDSTDPTSAVQVSLHNQDESQTALTLDGIPLSQPGAAGNLRAIGTDLFSGSQASFAATAGGLAGGVNFSTLQPTQAMQLRANATTGTFDRSNYAFAATGSLDQLGFVLEHTWRGANSPLTFQDYEDQSGFTYDHGGESSSLSDLVKLRYRLGDERTTITATALDTNRDAYAICAQDVTILPCGIGPGNRTYGRYGMAYATVQSLVGNVQTTLSGYTNSSTTTNDDLHAYILGANPSSGSNPSNVTDGPQLFPQLTFETAATRGIAYSASIAQGNHTFALAGNTYSATNASDPIVGSPYSIPFTNAASSSRYQFTDTIKSSDRLTLTPSVSFADTTGIGGSFLGGLSAAWSPHPGDAFALTLNVGSSQPNLSVTRSFTAPVSSRFNCAANSAVIGGPGDTGDGQKQSAEAVSLAWSHQFQGGNSLSVDAFSQFQSGQLITALIDEPISYYAAAGPGYLQAIYSAYRTPGVCGVSAPAPTVYVDESIAGTSRRYQGFDVTGRFALGHYVELLPNYSLNAAILTAAGPRLQDGPSTTIVGAQLPNRPLHRAGLTVDGLLPRSGLELLANAQYTGTNNQQNLGPYVNVSFGVSHRFGPGQLTLFENNAFNTYGGEFATDALAQPLPLSDGGTLATAATPLTPRSIFVSYAMAVGGPAPGPSFRQFARGSQLVAQATPSPGPSSGPRRATRFTSNPPPPGVDPLSLATARDACDADARVAAKPMYDALRAYVAAFSSGGKPAAVPNLTIVSQKATADPTISYYLELRPNLPRPAGAQAGGAGFGGFGRGGRDGQGGPPTGGGPPGGDVVAQSAPPPDSADAQAARRAFQNSPAIKGFRSFIGCAYVTILPADAAQKRGIAPAGGRPALLYVPTIGLVFVQTVTLPQGGGSLRRATGAPEPAASPAPAPSATPAA